MELSVQEFSEMSHDINNRVNKSFNDGRESEKDRQRKVDELSCFAIMLKHAKEKETLIEYHLSQNESDGANWIRVVPERVNLKPGSFVEIGFHANLNEIDYISMSE